GHLAARRVGHLVQPQNGLPILPSAIIQGRPVRPVGELVDVDDSPPIGVVGILRSRLHHPTLTLGQLQFGRRPGGSLPTRLLIPNRYALFRRPGDTGDLVQRDLASVFDHAVVGGQLLRCLLARHHRFLDPAWRNRHQGILHANELPVHILNLPTPAVHVITGDGRAKESLGGVRRGHAPHPADGGDEGPDRLPFFRVRVPPLQRRYPYHVVRSRPE